VANNKYLVVFGLILALLGCKPTKDSTRPGMTPTAPSIAALTTTVPSIAGLTNLYYEIGENSVSISECNNTALLSVAIPASINGKPVTSIESFAFSLFRNLTRGSIGKGVTSIGDSAFGECANLTSVTNGQGVTSIRSYAFYRCDSLTNVMFLGNAPLIGSSAFPIKNKGFVFKARKGVTGFESGIQGRSVELDQAR